MATERGLHRLLARPVDGASLAAFRGAFGLLMLGSTLRFIAKGWVTELYVQPAFHFPYFGLDWIRPWPSPWMHVHFAAMALLALLVAIGLFYRASIVLFFVSFTYVELIDKSTYLNHYYLISLLAFLMCFLPLHRAYSVDSWRKPSLRADTQPAWILGLLRFQIGLVYFFAGVAKLNPDWLLRAEPLRSWLPAHTELPIVGPLLGEAWVAFAMSWAGAIFDLSVFPLLLWRRSRPFAYLAVVFFHVVTWRLFHIGVFPWVMITITTVFFSPSWPRRILRPLGIRAPEPGITIERDARVPAAALAAWALLQIAIPLRAFAYPGPVAWTEEGFRFSWRVMLVEKNGQVDFQVRDPATGRTWVVHPREHLTPLQARMMSTQPDMILQYAHHLAASFREKGIDDPEVRADTWVALNGRPGRRLIDPDVDLARLSDGFAPKAWILPPDP